ncbi:OFA family MFS transporter [Capnocytophaga canimorsus]|uniref:OFA family MFS transporter n=1 Tax=Capnocytophaga canimorsus TaxID=28188 RepID=UPI001AD482EB|nr:OFA family MFS transporter [Capnocytophaga canimorsus]GIM56074.1 oxalate:formate antiporter [Capnocytophaga canimorsus]
MSNAWKIAFIGTIIHLFLGTVYAWSFFQVPIMELTQWNNLQTTMAFSLTILSLGITASWAGGKLERYGTTKLTIMGGLLFGLGYILASLALERTHLWGFYLSFGLISGCGLGLAYVTPVAVVSQWFSKKQGLATGMVVMGFGLGAFLMSKILAPLFFELTGQNVALSFRYFGIGFMLIIPLLGMFLKLPTNINSSHHSVNEITSTQKSSGKALLIWLIFTLNIIVGMIFLSFQSPLLQELILKEEASVSKETLTAAGATLIAVSAFFNGIGRLLWASLSDKIGRIIAFRWLIALEVICFSLLIVTQNVVLFCILVCLVLLCYGGGFGILPSLIKDEFGAERMPKIYGIMLTGWGIGGVIGTLSTAFLKDTFAYSAGMYAFCVGLVTVTIALAISFLVKARKP